MDRIAHCGSLTNALWVKAKLLADRAYQIGTNLLVAVHWYDREPTLIADTDVSSLSPAGLDLDAQPPQLPYELTSFHVAKLGQKCPRLNIGLLMHLS
jgi:hypothetical protein